MAPIRRPRHHGLLKMLGLSIGLHIASVAFLGLSPLAALIKAEPAVYTVSLMSVAPPGPKISKTSPMPVSKEEPRLRPPLERPVEKAKKDDLIEKVKKTPPPNLQEALEEIRRKAALDEIQKRVAHREKVGKVEEQSVPAPTRTPLASTVKPSVKAESKLDEYYSLVWAKIKESWTIPETLLRETVDLETVIVIIIERDGKIRRTWFEKKSNNPLYDQMAMRAIVKAEPLPSVPKEFTENSLELGIRFLPE